jgi:L-fucose isomerase
VGETNCKEGKDYNPPEKQRSQARERMKIWESRVKMALIARDLMVGNPKLAELGFGEEAHGPQRHRRRFPGTAPVDRPPAQRRLPGGDSHLLVRLERHPPPYIVATENDALNGVSMLFGHLLTDAAQIFADVRTYWSADAVKRVTGYKLTGTAAGGILHLINSGPATLDGTGQQTRNGKPVMKPFWEITKAKPKPASRPRPGTPAIKEYFRGGGWSTRFLHKRRHARHDDAA